MYDVTGEWVYFKSGFVQIVQEKLKYYDEVTSPCEPRDAREEEPWTWGPPPKQDEPAESWRMSTI